MKLKELLKNLADKKVYNQQNIEVEGITCDSRKVRNNYLFIALKGYQSDGHSFLQEAVSRGAKVVVVNRKTAVLPQDITEIVVPDTQDAVPALAGGFYRDPSDKIKIIGITGTNGKTTTAFIMKYLLEKAGFKTGLIGTIHYQIGERVISASNTTPGIIEINHLLSSMVEEKCDFCVMEVSSHGIEQGRIKGINFDMGIFTNIAPHEHLDYHRTFKNYLESKLKFFDFYLAGSRKGNKQGIVNIDDKYAKLFLKSLKRNKINFTTFGRRKADVKLTDYIMKKDGNYLNVEIDGKKEEFFTSIKGEGNIYNALAGISLGLTQSISIEELRVSLREIKSVPGRFETVNAGQSFDVIVDFAHTHAALYNLLHSIKKLNFRKVILVFGCGGDRDRSKRPLMGKVAAQMADIVFITSDNPRSENPERIISDIEKGIPFYLRNKYVSITDRREAIKEAVSVAGENDCVVVAGKGHETFQIVKNTTIPFDDRDEVAKAIKNRHEGRCA
jgi:UDP-N-acetylmuramoyl-L-alanyl-D-glutamate--2,6-diaminopimelate ligase